MKRNATLQTFFDNFEELFNDLGWGEPEAPKTDLKVELPFAGLMRDDLELNAHGNQLNLTVTKKELTGYQKAYEGYKRTFLVDPDYDLTKVTAKMDNGLLTIDLPLKEQARNAQFQIAVN